MSCNPSYSLSYSHVTLSSPDNFLHPALHFIETLVPLSIGKLTSGLRIVYISDMFVHTVQKLVLTWEDGIKPIAIFMGLNAIVIFL